MAKEQKVTLPALVVENYPVFDPKKEALLEAVIDANLGDDFTVRDLGRVKVPAGGGTVWCVPTPGGEVNREVLSGIIVGQVSSRAYWAKGQDEGGAGTPPDCNSGNMMTGVGTPGGECASCPFNVFGSAKDGKGRAKACKEVKNVLVLLEGSMLPILLSVPPTSLKAYKQYNVQLASGGVDENDISMDPVPYYGVMTHMRLSKTKNKDGIEYSELVLVRGESIPEEKVAMAAAYVKKLGNALSGAIAKGDTPDFD